MAFGSFKAYVVDVDSMEIKKTISINTQVAADGDQTLLYTHIVPNTGNRFVLEFNGSQFIYLRSIETGARQILIQGSPH